MIRSRLLRHSLLFLVSLLLVGCNTIAAYDRVAYEKATSAKAAALTVMDKATDSYASKEAVVTPLVLEVDQAYEYDRGRALNSITVQQWEILCNPDGHLFGNFLRRWREKGSLRPAFIDEKKKDIAEAFDQIIQLERGKRVITPNPTP
jgi:hypothetical protein